MYVAPGTKIPPIICFSSDVDNDEVDLLFLYTAEDVEDSMLITKVLEPLLEPGSVVKAAPTIGRPSEEVGADGDCEAVVVEDEEAAAGSAGAGAGADGSGSQLLDVQGASW